MKTSVWGPSAWKFLHSVTATYPEAPTKEHKDAARALFLSLRLLLPCEDCCSHYCQTFSPKDIEPALESRIALMRWLFDFHNGVNKRLGKPQYAWEQFLTDVQGEGSECSIESSCGDAVDAAPQRDSEAKTCSGISTLPTIIALLGLLFVVILIFSR